MTFSLDQFSLDGKIALVTGASRGIGQALSLALAGAGAKVIAAGREKAALDETISAIRAAGGTAHARQLDVSRVTEIDAVFAALVADGLAPDILVNNAGVEEVRPSIAVDEALWDRILDTNLKGAFFCARAFAALPHRGGDRSILNLCSLTSAVGIPTAVPYGSSKTGLVGMTRALSAEWAPLGLRVNGIGPGYFRTTMTEGFYADTAWSDAMLRKIPLGRFGDLEDLMGAAVFLSSRAARYITGQVLYIDGGTLARL
jgi:NAD(P)-dependent dehydrogenase (short-subunit alcohol dehydrogenase family)